MKFTESTKYDDLNSNLKDGATSKCHLLAKYVLLAKYLTSWEIILIFTYVDLCIAFIADAPVLNASTVSVVAFAPSSIIICNKIRHRK